VWEESMKESQGTEEKIKVEMCQDDTASYKVCALPCCSSIK